MATRRFRRGLTALIALAVVAGSAPAGAARRSPGRQGVDAEVALDLGIRLRMLRQLEELKAPRPILEALTSDDAATVVSGRSVTGYPMGDVTGDGVAEVTEFDLRYKFVIDPGSQDVNTIAEDEFTTIFRIRDGKTGRLHWNKRYDDFVIPVRAKVGKPARSGVIVVGGLLSFFGGSSGDRYLTFTGLRGTTGKRLWFKRYMSVAATHDYTTVVAADSPVSFAFVQAREDGATEILLGLATIAEALFTTTAATRTVLLSGGDGTDVMHPHVDVGIDWLPFPDAVADVDGDGLDDYVVANDKGFYPGDGQDSPAVGGVIQARRGIDGEVVWTEGGLELRYFAFILPLAHVVGDRTSDFGILTYNREVTNALVPPLPILPDISNRDYPVVMLTDAGAGNVLWTRRAQWIHSPGDVDHDGDTDVVLERLRFDHSNNAIHYSRLAYPGIGKRIWEHRLVWRGEPCLANICVGGGGAGFGPAGDVHPDRIRDRFVIMGLHQPNREEYASFVLEGDSDRTLIRSDETLMPLYVAVDGKGADVLNAQVDRHQATFRVRRGNTGDTLWTSHFTGTEQLLPKDTAAYAFGFSLPGDRCGDLVMNIWNEDSTLYAVADGGSGKVLWSKWIGPRGQRPRLTNRRDLNHAC